MVDKILKCGEHPKHNAELHVRENVVKKGLGPTPEVYYTKLTLNGSKPVSYKRFFGKLRESVHPDDIVRSVVVHPNASILQETIADDKYFNIASTRGYGFRAESNTGKRDSHSSSTRQCSEKVEDSVDVFCNPSTSVNKDWRNEVSCNTGIRYQSPVPSESINASCSKRQPNTRSYYVGKVDNSSSQCTYRHRPKKVLKSPQTTVRSIFIPQHQITVIETKETDPKYIYRSGSVTRGREFEHLLGRDLNLLMSSKNSGENESLYSKDKSSMTTPVDSEQLQFVNSTPVASGNIKTKVPHSNLNRSYTADISHNSISEKDYDRTLGTAVLPRDSSERKGHKFLSKTKRSYDDPDEYFHLSKKSCESNMSCSDTYKTPQNERKSESVVNRTSRHSRNLEISKKCNSGSRLSNQSISMDGHSSKGNFLSKSKLSCSIGHRNINNQATQYSTNRGSMHSTRCSKECRPESISKDRSSTFSKDLSLNSSKRELKNERIIYGSTSYNETNLKYNSNRSSHSKQSTRALRSHSKVGSHISKRIGNRSMSSYGSTVLDLQSSSSSIDRPIKNQATNHDEYLSVPKSQGSKKHTPSTDSYSRDSSSLSKSRPMRFCGTKKSDNVSSIKVGNRRKVRHI